MSIYERLHAGEGALPPGLANAVLYLLDIDGRRAVGAPPRRLDGDLMRFVGAALKAARARWTTDVTFHKRCWERVCCDPPGDWRLTYKFVIESDIAISDTKLMKLTTYFRSLQPGRDYARRCVVFARAAAHEAFRSESMSYFTDVAGEVLVCSLEGCTLRPTTGTVDIRSTCCPYSMISKAALL